MPEREDCGAGLAITGDYARIRNVLEAQGRAEQPNQKCSERRDKRDQKALFAGELGEFILALHTVREVSCI